MGSALRIPILVLCVVVAFTAPIGAQEITNWPAPPLWSPADRPVSAGSVRALSTEGIAATQASSPLPFIALTPCRIADTRGNGFTGAYGPPSLSQGSPRNFTLFGQCGIPVSAGAVSLNITVTNTLGPGFILIFPQGGTQPAVSTLNYVAGQTVANAAVVALGTGGGVTVVAGVSGTDLIIDTNGFYGGPTEDLSNVFLGPLAGNSTTIGSGNTGIGNEALFNNSEGNGNTATGNDALATNNTGSFNTANGFVALLKNNGGSGNTAIGVSALFNNTIGFENTAVGHAAGANLTTGDNNIDIGNAGVAGDSDTIRIGTGGTHIQTFLAGVRGVTTGLNDAVAVMIDSGGQLGTLSSSRRFKQDIEDMGSASLALIKLRPVTFRYKASLDPTGSPQYGLIAEEVAEVFPDLVVYGKDGQPETVRYHFLVPLLINEVQKDRKAIADLTARLERLERSDVEVHSLERSPHRQSTSRWPVGNEPAPQDSLTDSAGISEPALARQAK